MTSYRSREIGGIVDDALEAMPVAVLTGMRQTGKTTFLTHHPSLSERRYVSLDDFASLEAARRDPEGFIAGNRPLTIDEAQRCPELLTAIKIAVDDDRTAGRFLLSGSANFSLLRQVSESLAGRAVYLTLGPLSWREINETRQRPGLLDVGEPREGDEDPHALDLEAAVVTGGMPVVALDQTTNAGMWFTGFEQTYLERDLRELSQVADLLAFRRLLRLAALRTGQVLNQSEVGRDAGLNAITTGRYLGLLEASFVIDRLPPYLANPTSRLIKSPKLYVTDSGLAHFLAGSPTLEGPLRGALVETWVAQNLRAILAAHQPRARLHYWNVQGRHEVDFVIDEGASCVAIEVKSGSRWGERDLSGLKAFVARNDTCRAGVLAHAGSRWVSLGDRLWAVPLAGLLG